MRNKFLNTASLLIVLALASSVTIAQCRFRRPASRRSVSYSFEPVFSDDKMSLRVTLEFFGGRSGKSELEVPSSYAGQKDLSNAFSDFRVLSPDTTLTAATFPSANKILLFRPNSVVRISYLLVKDWHGRLDSDTRFRPILERNYFQILSDTGLIKPKLDPESTMDVYFDWQKLPADWSLATSFGLDDRCQSFHGAWKQVKTALFVGGDYRIEQAPISGNPLTIAIRGKWMFSDTEWTQQVQRIIKTERTLLRDNDFHYFLVVLAPFDQDGGSYGGSAYTNAFMMHLPRKATLSYEVISLLAHENFHLWNPYKMGGEQGEGVSWFTEGFTRYYTDLILFLSDYLSLSEYIDHINEKLRRYELSPVRNVSNAEIIARYNSDSSLNDLPGERGMAFALWLDSHIRKQTGNRTSLDAVIFELLKRGRRKGFKLETNLILDVAEKYLGAHDQILREYIEDGKTIPLPEFEVASCVGVRSESAVQFELGMDKESLRKKYVVASVKPDSEAFKAGLRDGQQVVRLSVSWDDPSKLVKITVRGAGGDHAYEYYPKGPSLEIQQYYLKSPCS